MPKLNSIELKHKRKILNWAGENWHSIKEENKTRIWIAIFNKEMPTKFEGRIEHDVSDRFFEMAEQEFGDHEARLFRTSEN